MRLSLPIDWVLERPSRPVKLCPRERVDEMISHLPLISFCVICVFRVLWNAYSQFLPAIQSVWPPSRSMLVMTPCQREVDVATRRSG